MARVDLDTGKLEKVAELPGFTRGLAFAGPYAFVGLSEAREATTFSGLPLTGRLEQRECGVWVVNIDTGATVGFLRFEDLVEEILTYVSYRGCDSLTSPSTVRRRSTTRSSSRDHARGTGTT